MRLWLTAQEIADLGLAGFPGSKRGVQKLIERNGWMETHLCRRRSGGSGAGGGGGFEYHLDLFPIAQKLAYAGSFIRIEQEDFVTETDLVLTPKERQARDARLIVTKVADRFRKTSDMQAGASDALFAVLYEAGDVAVPEWVRETVKRLSHRTLARWREHAKANKNRLASDPSKARKGTGVLDRAEDGRLRAFCLAVYASNQFLSAKHIRNTALAEFGPSVLIETRLGQKRVGMPPLRTFQSALKSWKDQHGNALLKITDPDAYKSKVRFVATGANKVDRLNQKWEVDASPSDVMTTDGRRNIYAAIDLYSRRSIILVTDTARAAAVGLLIRKCLMEWGVPEVIKTDNGSDFTAKTTLRLLDALGIEQELSTPYSPEQKGTVERVIGTFQRDCAATLPGFIGHSVADRKIIENRKAFSARLGTDDAKLFKVEYSAADLQSEADRWATEQYAHTPHEGLKRKTPFEVANAWAGSIRRIEDARALDVLLAPIAGKDGLRRVTKQGIRIDGEFYQPFGVLPGSDVFCRHDPADLGRLWLFAEDGESYLGEAICPALSGEDPAQITARQRALQKAVEEDGLADIRKEKRKITPRTVADAQRAAYRHNADIVAFPKAASGHATPKTLAALQVGHKPMSRPLSAGERAMMDSLTANDQLNVSALCEANTPDQRFGRALRFEARIGEGEVLSDEDAIWLSRYQAHPEYRARKLMLDAEPQSKRSVPPAS
ncbi:DDE-type integrase/transposase/recombinase [Roseibium sp.]|uniref:DDE-type integrase/transposase/recombinase n=1 Tax=Roseibium sp. TaxID=1936156 RepID=UPI003A974111